MKTILPYMPLTFDRISAKVFKSFLEMTNSKALANLAVGGYELLDPYICDKFPIDLNRNHAFDYALNKVRADMIFCADADQVFKKDTLTTLVNTLDENPEVDAVTGVYFTKTFPHRAVAGKYSPWSDSLRPKEASLKNEGFVDKDGNQTLYFKHLQYFTVTQPIDVFGLGCILIRTEAFNKIQQPYCKYVNMFSTGGDYTFLGHSEDMWLCSQFKQNGVKTLINPKVMVGHVTERVIVGNEAEE